MFVVLRKFTCSFVDVCKRVQKKNNYPPELLIRYKSQRFSRFFSGLYTFGMTIDNSENLVRKTTCVIFPISRNGRANETPTTSFTIRKMVYRHCKTNTFYAPLGISNKQRSGPGEGDRPRLPPPHVTAPTHVPRSSEIRPWLRARSR